MAGIARGIAVLCGAALIALACGFATYHASGPVLDPAVRLVTGHHAVEQVGDQR